MEMDLRDWIAHSGLGSHAQPCGVFRAGPSRASNSIAVPLRRRQVCSKIYPDGKFAEQKEIFTFSTETDCTAVFRFPLPPRSALHRFQAVIGDREVVTKVKPRAQACEEYELAVQQGHAAVHLSQQERVASVFEVSLGNLEAHVDVIVELSYVRLLESFGGTILEWIHTATWVPPYTGSEGDAAAGDEKGNASPNTAKVSYTLSYDITVLAEPGAVRLVESSQPSAEVLSPAEGDNTAAPEALVLAGGAGPSSGSGSGSGCWRVRVSEQVADPSKDLALTIELDPEIARRSSLRVQRTPATRRSGGGGGDVRTVALATFVPPPPPPSPPPQSGPSAAATPQLRKEIWFVVDCSGSMGGRPIEQAREAALLFVRDLPVGSSVRFNVTCFGSSYRSLYNECRMYDADTEREALDWIQRHVTANMGGTEILFTFKLIYGTPISPGYTREVIFLTDGGISGSDEQAMYDIVTPSPATAATAAEGGGVRSRAGGSAGGLASLAPEDTAARLTHVLCLGIGHGVHRGLLDGVAQRSQGLAVYVLDEESISAKISFLKKAATAQGAARKPRLVVRGALVRPTPHLLPQRIFPGEPLQILVEVISCEPDATLELVSEYCSSSASGPHAAADATTAAASNMAVGGFATGSDFSAIAEDAATREPLSVPTSTGAPRQLMLSLDLGAALAGGADGRAAGVEEGEALGVLHAMSYISSLLSGTSPLHIRPDGSALLTPSPDLVREAIVRLAVTENLVTPYTFAVGYLLRRNPSDPAAGANVVEVPLQLPHGRKAWRAPDAIRPQPAPGGRSRALGVVTGTKRAAAALYGAPFGTSCAGATATLAVQLPGTAGGAKQAHAPDATPAQAQAQGTAAQGFPLGSWPWQFTTGDGGAAGAMGTGIELLPQHETPEQTHDGVYSAAAVMQYGEGGAAETGPPGAPNIAGLGSVGFPSGGPFRGPIGPEGYRRGAEPVCGIANILDMHFYLAPYVGGGPTLADNIFRRRSEAQESGESIASAQPSAALASSGLLAYLNLHRTTEGYWQATRELGWVLGPPADQLLYSQPPQQQPASASADAGAGDEQPEHQAQPEGQRPTSGPMAGLRPDGLSDDAWATVVVLAFLRRSLASQREVWADMEAKALGWLERGWPHGPRSMGGTVLAVAQALAATGTA